MLRKCYEYHGWWGTLPGEVSQQAKYLSRRGIPSECAPRAQAQAQARLYARADKLEAASWKLERSWNKC